jgi:hypothetical protein
MAKQSPPDAQMYEAHWQRNGESIGRLYISATKEAHALAQAEDFFARFPALDFRRGRRDATVDIRLLPLSAAAADWHELRR